jgi:hypothetical protein
MCELESPRQRRSPASAIERRETASVVHPYLTSIHNWQRRLVRLRIRKIAASSSGDDRVAARLELGELLEEVQEARRTFETTIAGHQIRGRIADVRASLERLSASLAMELR